MTVSGLSNQLDGTAYFSPTGKKGQGTENSVYAAGRPANNGKGNNVGIRGVDLDHANYLRLHFRSLQAFFLRS